MSGLLSEDDVRGMLDRAVKRAGSQAAFCREHRLPPSLLNEVLSGKRPPGGAVIHALGVTRATGYDFKDPRP